MTDSELPVPDWDEQPLGAVEHRIRSLDADALRSLRAHEEGHAARPAVLRLLDERSAQLAAGAEPTPGGESAPSDSPDSGRSGSPVSPATEAPPQHSPPHGSPHQPGQGDRMGP